MIPVSGNGRDQPDRPILYGFPFDTVLLKTVKLENIILCDLGIFIPGQKWSTHVEMIHNNQKASQTITNIFTILNSIYLIIG